jgi:hypothetical protein
MHALVLTFRIVVVALRFHLGLRLMSLWWASQQADPIGLQGA